MKRDLVFLAVFSVLAILYYDTVLTKGPMNAHIWRQTDCLSLAQNYADGASFLEPEMHIQLGDGKTSGKTAGEFPLLYYIVGQLWNLLGTSYFIYRLLYLLILAAGLFALYRFLFLLFKDLFWSITLTALVFTSPAFVSYGVSFLSDVPAVCFGFIALYQFSRYVINDKIQSLVWSAIGFSLAGLLKVSSLIPFIILLTAMTLGTLGFRSLGSIAAPKTLKQSWIAASTVLLSILSWYLYAWQYNDTHRFKYTFNDIHPIWILTKEEIGSVLAQTEVFTSVVFFSRPMLFLIPLLFLVNLALVKRMHPLASLCNLLTMLGTCAFLVLWAPLLGHHDYYFCVLVVTLVGIAGPSIQYFLRNAPMMARSLPIRIAASVFLLYSVLYCSDVVKLKTHRKNLVAAGQLNPVFVNNMKVTNWTVNEWHAYERMNPTLPRMGIQANDLIIAIDDHSFNTSLFLANRKGWTAFEQPDSVEELNELIKKGARFLFVSEHTLKLPPEYLRPYLGEEIGAFEHVRIYRLPTSGV